MLVIDIWEIFRYMIMLCPVGIAFTTVSGALLGLHACSYSRLISYNKPFSSKQLLLLMPKFGFCRFVCNLVPKGVLMERRLAQDGDSTG